MTYKTIVNVPKVADPSLAVRLWYEQTEIGTNDVCDIFGCSKSTAIKLKARAREEMEESKTPSFNSTLVNTECAYRSWGIDVKRLEKGLNRPKLRLCDGG